MIFALRKSKHNLSDNLNTYDYEDNRKKKLVCIRRRNHWHEKNIDSIWIDTIRSARTA
nr:MAG TPA: hypothetical protein [Caudoviricetes sp.]DAL46707.1 MAG TPA_asm: hypothetical protein [Bacteriophage sp.]